jgi:glucokinase
MANPAHWNLVADIGGTNARFAAMVDGQMETEYMFHYSVSDYPQFYGLIDRLLEEIAEVTGWSSSPDQACLAIACPADHEQIVFTNSDWEFSKTYLEKALGCKKLTLINDFNAVALSITELGQGDLIQIGGDQALPGKPMGILGAGTGLGMAALVPSAGQFVIIDAEGGHIDFAPVDDLQIKILSNLMKRYGRVSVERLLSGAGLLNIYQAICSIRNKQNYLVTPAEVSNAALEGNDPVAVETLNVFCEVLGAVAGDIALIYGAKGGVYIAGGIVPRFPEFFAKSRFRERFEAKGRFANYLKPIPAFLITRKNLGLLGAAKNLLRN